MHFLSNIFGGLIKATAGLFVALGLFHGGAAINASPAVAVSPNAAIVTSTTTASTSEPAVAETIQSTQVPIAAPVSPRNSILCNGAYYADCSNGSAPICPGSGAAYCPSSQPVQQPVQETPATQASPSPSGSLQTEAQCASLGLQKETSDRTDLLGTEIIVKDAYGYSPSLNTCIYAAQYEASALGTDTGTYFNLNTGTEISLPEAGTWQMSSFSLPASEFTYGGYVYDCNKLPVFISTTNQVGQPDWIEVSTDSTCGTVWIYHPGINVGLSLGSVASMNSTDASNVDDFWNEYYTLVPQ